MSRAPDVHFQRNSGCPAGVPGREKPAGGAGVGGAAWDWTRSRKAGRQSVGRTEASKCKGEAEGGLGRGSVADGSASRAPPFAPREAGSAGQPLRGHVARDFQLARVFPRDAARAG